MVMTLASHDWLGSSPTEIDISKAKGRHQLLLSLRHVSQLCLLHFHTQPLLNLLYIRLERDLR